MIVPPPWRGGPTVPQASKQRPDTPENIQAVTLEREETAVATLEAMCTQRCPLREATLRARARAMFRAISHRATPTAGRLVAARQQREVR